MKDATLFGYNVMVAVSVAQWSKAPGCGPGDRGFKSLHSPQLLTSTNTDFVFYPNQVIMLNHSPDGIISVDQHMVDKAAITIANAFAEDPGIVYALPNPSKLANFPLIIAYQLKLDLMNGGKVYTTSPECEGVACWHPPETRSSWINQLRAGYFRLPFYGGLHYMRYSQQEDRFFADLKSKYAPHKCIYLTLLGVAPQYQGMGYASRLIRYMIQYADKKNLPCYLETQNTTNVNMYSKFGFKLKGSTHFPPGSECEVHIMIRDAVYV